MRGTTITDLLVAVGIGGILLGLAVPNLAALRAPYALRSATTTLASDMAVARMRAIAQNRRQRVQILADAGTWQLQQEVAPGNFQAVGGLRMLPNDLKFAGSDMNLIFNTRGMVNTPATLKVKGRSGTRTVLVNVLGQATIIHDTPQA